MLVLDSRDQQGNLWLPCNAEKLAVFTIFTAKTPGKTRLVQSRHTVMYQQPRKLCNAQVCYLQEPLTRHFKPLVSL